MKGLHYFYKTVWLIISISSSLFDFCLMKLIVNKNFLEPYKVSLCMPFYIAVVVFIRSSILPLLTYRWKERNVTKLELNIHRCMATCTMLLMWRPNLTNQLINSLTSSERWWNINAHGLLALNYGTVLCGGQNEKEVLVYFFLNKYYSEFRLINNQHVTVIFNICCIHWSPK